MVPASPRDCVLWALVPRDRNTRALRAVAPAPRQRQAYAKSRIAALAAAQAASGVTFASA